MAEGHEITRAEINSYIFRKSIHMQLTLQALLRATGDLRGKRCLAIGSVNAMMSLQLRKAGGEWLDVVFDSKTAAAIKELTGDEDVKIIDHDDPLPFDSKSFDIVLILSGLSVEGSDYDFIEKCHKVMDSDGHLVLSVARRKKLSLMAPIRSMFGVPEYMHTERQLFDILKNGFDVMHMRSFSRFFMELTDAATRGAARRRGYANQMGVYRIAYPFYFLAYQFDVLIFFTKGHRLVALAKRHAWRSRQAPILSDGRSISEAVLKPLTD